MFIFQEHNKNTQIQVNILPFSEIITRTAFMVKINGLELLEGRK